MRPGTHTLRQGFTLIELAIVLVIIGLIVGGILLGRDLIVSAGVRAQLSQIEKYEQAVNTFYGKYGALPGDMSAVVANQFGGMFVARGQYGGQGDGNGILQGNYNNCSTCIDNVSPGGEPTMFWQDLTAAGLVEGPYSGGSATGNFPPAKIGQGNYVYVWSGGYQFVNTVNVGDEYNYFSISAVSALGWGISSTPALTAAQAYKIDSKIDDGLPQSGRVMALYVQSQAYALWAGTANYGAPYTTATPQTTTTCFDNNDTAGSGQQYSLGSLAGYGAYMNCALSFRFQ